jgi:hypothetical protein
MVSCVRWLSLFALVMSPVFSTGKASAQQFGGCYITKPNDYICDNYPGGVLSYQPPAPSQPPAIAQPSKVLPVLNKAMMEKLAADYDKLQELIAQSEASGEPLPPGVGGGGAASEAKPMPAATRVVCVSSCTRLSAAVQNAQPGDHIVLKDGSYNCGFTVSRSGQDGKPIVIRAANTLGARINGNFSLNGNHVWLVGIDMGTSEVDINGADNRISSNRFRRAENPVRVGRSARRAEVDHNEVDQAGASGTSNAHCIRAEYDAKGPDNLNHYIHHNYCHDAKGHNNNAIVSSENQHTREVHTDTLIEYNLIENWPGGRQVGVKSGGNIIRFNTSVGGGREEWGNRSGIGNQWIANWSDSARFNIVDRDTVLIGNYSPKRGFALQRGNTTWEIPKSQRPGTWYLEVVNTYVCGNTGPLSIGEIYSKVAHLPTLNTRVEGHTGSINRELETGTTISSTVQCDAPKAFKLDRSQVGPFAATAPKPPGGSGCSF